MIIVLIGKTASGKTLVSEELMKVGFHRIVTTTTRPMRDGEIDGYTYHFISDEEFHNKVDEDFFLEYKSYTVADGSKWYYGSPKDEFYSSEDSIIILTPDGYRDFLKHNIPHKSIYIYSNLSTIRKRLIERGDDKAEAERRVQHDIIDFKGIENEVDFIVYNNYDSDINSVVNTILEKVKGI
jgi:guanylate kinase